MDENFPLYRKYPNNKSYFKVFSKTRLEELVIFGESYDLVRIEARILPEFNLIQDLIENEGKRWVEVKETEYESTYRECMSRKRRVGDENKG